MKATEQLRAEHQGVLAMLDNLDAIAAELEQGAEPRTAELESILDFLKTFVDRCHHGKEEELLFPALVRAGLARDGGPVGVMLAEHEEGRGLVRRMAASLAEPRSFSEAARAYSRFLRSHIEKENGVLFPMADQLLDGKAQDSLFEGFEEIEEKRIGAGKHEAYHALIDELARKHRAAG